MGKKERKKGIKYRRKKRRKERKKERKKEGKKERFFLIEICDYRAVVIQSTNK